MGSPIDWQVTKKKVEQRGKYLLETGVWSDCSFVVGTEPHHQVFAGHKLFLAMSSPVFEAMFFGGMAEKNDHPIPILDVQPEAFKALLEYIYTDTINLNSFDQACELCYGAKKYMLPHLVEECTSFLWSDLYPKNACRAYEFAKLFEEPTLMDKCLQIISRRTQEVLSEGSFEDVELNTLITIYSQENLNIDSELDLFKALSRYASKHGNSGVVAKKPRVESNGSPPAAECSITHPTMRDVLMKIRFLTLTPQQFADGPALSDLLSQSEKFDIFMNISSQLSSTPMPAGFSTSTCPRKKCLHYNSADNQIQYCDSDSTMMGAPCDHPPVTIMPTSEEHVRNMPRFYCTRSLVQQTDCLNVSTIDCSVTFSVDRNICIIGVQVPSQVLGHMNGPQPVISRLYSELLYANLGDADGSRLTYLHYTARVNFRSMIDLTFNRPVYIQRNKDYKVGVVFNRPGWYPMGTCTGQSTVAGVTFSFAGSCSDTVRDGLIRSIIFSY